jgi:hypothetical protein
MEMFCIFLQNMINIGVELKVVTTLHKDTTQLIVYNLMGCLLNLNLLVPTMPERLAPTYGDVCLATLTVLS